MFPQQIKFKPISFLNFEEVQDSKICDNQGPQSREAGGGGGHIPRDSGPIRLPERLMPLSLYIIY